MSLEWVSNPTGREDAHKDSHIAVLIVGVGGWEEWTKPAIQSIRAHDWKGVDLYVLDNGTHGYQLGEYHLLRSDETLSYAAAINAGMRIVGDPDWLVVLNNDITATGSIRESLEWLDDGALWGNQLITFNDLRWLGLWLFAIPRSVREAVGEFDENFAVCGFDDLDYCIRAREAGFRIEKSELPITHHWGKTRWGIPNYEEIREQNKAYLEEKHGVSLAGEWQVFN